MYRIQVYDQCGVWMSSLLALPIRSGAKVVGVMLMVNKGKNEVFTDRDKTSVEVCSILISKLVYSAFCYTQFCISQKRVAVTLIQGRDSDIWRLFAVSV